MKRPNLIDIDHLLNELHREGRDSESLFALSREAAKLAAYIRHLEDQLDAVKLAARWQPGTRVWYRRVGGKRSIAVPGVVISVRGQRVRVNFGAADGTVRDVSPGSLRHPDKMSEWQKAAVMIGLIL